MTNRTIPCPTCEEEGYTSHPYCPLCKGSGTIPDRRTPTASDRAVERIKAMFDKWLDEYKDEGTALRRVRAIIREEEGQ